MIDPLILGLVLALVAGGGFGIYWILVTQARKR